MGESAQRFPTQEAILNQTGRDKLRNPYNRSLTTQRSQGLSHVSFSIFRKQRERKAMTISHESERAKATREERKPTRLLPPLRPMHNLLANLYIIFAILYTPSRVLHKR
ncbi:hypothetical protein BYT27DRAFT_7262830 [Phlegmacium glaucopus]|nr:hypothetical protein BYT27DRAFT_7262830 [Phlegmacium glaucopus]